MEKKLLTSVRERQLYKTNQCESEKLVRSHGAERLAEGLGEWRGRGGRRDERQAHPDSSTAARGRAVCTFPVNFCQFCNVLLRENVSRLIHSQLEESPLQAGERRVHHQPAELADTPPVRGAAPSSFYGGAGRQAPAARRSILFGARMPQPAPAPAAPRAAVPATAAVLFFDDDSVDSIHSLQLSTPPMARTLSAQAREARKLVFRLTLQRRDCSFGGETCW